MTVNPSTMRLGIASILIGLVGAYGVRVMMDEEAPTVAEAAARKVPVPLAGQDLPAGRIVQRGDIALRPMTAAEMEQASMPLNLVMMSADDIVGRQLRKPLRQSEPFLTTSIYLEGEEPSYDLKPGYRAVSVVVSMGRGGYAEAGDVVDVAFTSEAKAANRRTGAAEIPQMTIHVASAVTVLEVTRPELNALQARVGYVEKDPSFLLQVEPDLVPKFQALQGYGDFSLMIRPKDDVGGIAKNADGKPMTFAEAMGFPPAEPPQQPPVWPVEIYKRGSRGVQYFPIPQPSPEQIAEYQRQYEEYQKQLAAAGGADPTAADASPADSQPAPTPAPVRQRPTLREPAMPDDAPAGRSEPSIPYRASEPTPAPKTSAPLPRSGSPLPRSSPLPRTSAPATGSASSGPVEEVLP